MCHKNHDVGYSRKSSFFCDCGAEEVSSGSRQKCKCLTPIDDTTFNLLNSNEVATSIDGQSQREVDNPAKLLFLTYPEECANALQLLTKEAKTSSWNQTILTLFKSFKTDRFDFSFLHESAQVGSKSYLERPDLSLRCGVPLNLQLLDNQSMLPVRAAKAGSVKIGMMSSSPVTHMRRHRNGRHLIESDVRGRIVCAESNSLLFFSAIPSINTRHMATPYSSHLSRSQLCCLGSERVSFDVHGIRYVSR